MDFETIQAVLILLWVPFVLGCFVWSLSRRHAPNRRWMRPERIRLWDWLGLLFAGFGNDPGVGSSGPDSPPARKRKRQAARPRR